MFFLLISVFFSYSTLWRVVVPSTKKGHTDAKEA
ncbi:hypothetical protein GLYMA_19G028301v4 [Glycine max]|nr:hypothetical protein GLYMA_19G028301v4 [Glycine max]